MKKQFFQFLLSGLIIVSACLSVYADDSDLFFDDTVVQEIRIYFSDPDWYSTLYSSHANDPDDPYFEARFEYGDIVLDPVGVRFKGNSSFNINGVKKSIKVDFNTYNEDTVFLDMKKLNLNNGYKDPTMMRAKMFLDFASQYVPAIRAVHTRVYINDEYWGLYTAVEQIDKTFCQNRFGDDEDGNLFKGAGSDDMTGDDFNSDLVWLGSNPTAYYDYYQLKTNETENDYSQLIEFIDILNNTSTASLPAEIEPVFDVSNGLMGLALNSLFVNLDAYSGSAHNYYLYDRDDTGQFTHIHWDTNEAFGRFTMFVSHWDDPLELDPFWLPESMGPPPPTDEDRPLMENLWAVDDYSKEYLRDLAQMLREGFNATAIETRANQLADLIRTDVYADSNKMYSNSQFETNLTSNVQDGNSTVYGLRYFVQQRSAYLDDRLDDFAEDSDMRINEIMVHNTATVQDGAGDYDPWIEIYNLGPGEVNLSGLYLTDTPSNPTKWALPSVTVDDGDYQILWVDGETGEGNTHANFTLNILGGTLYLYESGSNLVDSISYPSMMADTSSIRLPDGKGDWEMTDQPSPGSENTPSSIPVTLYINEFMADNETIIEDPDEPGVYEDWIEIYNPNDEAMDLSGMYLTDDLTDPTQYAIPQGVEIAANSYLIFWADDDSSQGPLHTNFKLAVNGEQIGLFDSDLHGNQAIDTITYETQSIDVSYCRCPDGSDTWVNPDFASPGSTNCQTPSPTPTPYGTPTATPTPVDTPNLKINEFMASNSTTITDNMGEYDDWIEIYNADNTMIDLSGMYLSDNESLPTQWQIPDGTILAPGGFLIIWCDNDEEQGEYHTNFKLSAGGEYIGIFGSDSLANTLIDGVDFDEQTTDISLGRCPDGSDSWQLFEPASPGSTNGSVCHTPTPEPTSSGCINHGDVDLNGALTAGDAQLAFQIALGGYSPDYEEECAADCNGDDGVTAGDAQQIFFAVLGSGACVDPV